MSPNTGNIYDPAQMEELQRAAPDFAETLKPLSNSELKALRPLSNHERVARLDQIRSQRSKSKAARKARKRSRQ